MKILSTFRGVLFRALVLPVMVLSFMQSPSVTGKPPVSAETFESDLSLQAASDALLPLFEPMASVPVYLSDEAVQKAGTSTEKGVAYTHCKGNRTPSIYIKKTFYQKANRKQLDNILKHELTHAWLCRQHLMSGHDARFREKFRAVGGFGN